MDNLVDYSENPKVSCLFKGKPGGGKTAAALSFPGPVLYIQTDPNTETVRKMAKGTKVLGLRLTQWKQWEKDVRPALKAIRNGELEVGTIVVDTWSFFAQLITDSLQGPDGKLKMQDWGVLLNRQKELLLELIMMTLPEGSHPGCHVVVNCHTKENVDDEGRLQSVGLALQGQFKDHMEAYFDYVLVCETVNKKKVENGKSTDVREYVIHASPPHLHTTKGGSLPAKVLVPEGESAFAHLNKTWNV